MIKSRNKTERVLLICLILTAVWNVVSVLTPVRSLTSFLYMALVLFWILSLRKEVFDPYIRHRLQFGGVFFIALFIARILRWNVAPDNSLFSRMCWYFYYIPTLLSPYLSLELALYIGRKNDRKRKLIMIPILLSCMVLLGLVVTNELHMLVIKIWYEGAVEKSRSGIVFYILMVWYFGGTLAAFCIMMYKCRISVSKKLWWIPTFVETMGIGLSAIYMAKGGSSPRIGGISLYNIQEIYMLIFIGFWEACIYIGLIPTNSLVENKDWIKDGLLKCVGKEVDEMKTLLDDLKVSGEDDFRDRLKEMCCLGAYVKRRSNLEIIADEKGFLNTSELTYSIRESMEYYSLNDITVGYEDTGNAEVPALLVTTAYELFEDVIKKAVSACYVKLHVSEEMKYIKFRMMIEADMDSAEDEAGSEKKRELLDKEILSVLGAKLSVEDRDDTMFIDFSAKYMKGTRLHGFSRIRLKKQTPDSYGLSGLARYLSLEKEALGAKITVHDSLGRSLLMSKKYLIAEETGDREAVLSEWEQNLKITGDIQKMSSGGFTSDRKKYLECLTHAKKMGVDVEIDGILPGDKELQEICDMAITVHVTNVIRHTSGKKVFIKVQDNLGSYRLELYNDGEPLSEYRGESGGLKNLRARVSAVSGEMMIETSPRFKLKLILPKGRKDEL